MKKADSFILEASHQGDPDHTTARARGSQRNSANRWAMLLVGIAAILAHDLSSALSPLEPLSTQEGRSKSAQTDSNSVEQSADQVRRPLSWAYAKALEFDPVYAAASAESLTHKVQSRMASMAYFPEARLSVTQFDAEASARTTVSLSQPILHMDRWLAMKESSPRDQMAQASLAQSQSDLALRLFRSVSALAEARERQRLNEAAITALRTQHVGAKKAYDLGQGTITDVRDTQLRLTQAQSQSYALESQRQAASRQLAAMLGPESAHPAHFHQDLEQELAQGLSRAPLNWSAMPQDHYLTQASQSNPSIVLAQAAVRLAQIAAQRSKAVFLPSVSAVMQRSEIASGPTINSNSIGLRMDVPLGASSIYKASTAGIDVKKAHDQLRAAESRIRLDVQRLHAASQSLSRELEDRRQAVEFANLGVVANENSFKGGVRSKVDVLNSIQALQQAQLDYMLTRLRLAESVMELHLARGDDVSQTLDFVQRLAFE